MRVARVLLAVSAVATLAVAASGCGGAAPTASPEASCACSTPPPTPAPTFGGTFALEDGPDFSDVAAPTSGVLFPWYERETATRHPIAVMIDDQQAARPQSGLSQADIVYHAPAEGGIPRYMAVFQTQLPDSIGPIRSSRLYYVAWAEEWRAMYVHHWGAPNAMNRLVQINGKLIYDADGLKWEGRYMHRVTFRSSPHNLYTSGAELAALATRLGATAPFTQSPFVFSDEPPAFDRPAAGRLLIPYHGNTVTYTYDRIDNTYRRGVSGQTPQLDFGNGLPIAPYNVVVLYQQIGLLPVEVGQAAKNRLEIQYLGSGKATVYNNGQAIEALWSKKTEESPTLLTYASGPLVGQPVPLVRGQIFIQVVPTGAKVTWTPSSA